MPADPPDSWDGVSVEGLVGAPTKLTLKDLAQFSQARTTYDFRCHDGWVAHNQTWGGVRVAEVLEAAKVSDAARFVVFSHEGHAITLPLAKATAATTLLAVELNGGPVPAGNGGPCRLAVGGKMGPAYVKWVDCIRAVGETPSQ
jgi:DMSO/TMAO reductase YedYZ molybdopterin-dependent catalytic subunit